MSGGGGVKLATQVRRLSKVINATPSLEEWKPLVALLLGMAVDYDSGDLPAVAYQQLRVGLGEVREAILMSKESEGQAGHLQKLLEEYKARENAPGG